MYAPWYLAIVCAVTLYFANREDRKVLLTGKEDSPILGLLYSVSFLGFLICFIWSFFIAWWAFIPVLVLFFSAYLYFPSAEEKELLSVFRYEKEAREKEDFSSGKQSREQKRLKTIFMRHYEQAKGTDFQRSLIAATMASLEADSVRAECKRRAKNERLIFLITYECFILWIIKSALESVLSENKAQEIMETVKEYVAKNGHYESEPFERIWNSVLLHMPQALVPGSDGTTFPVAELLLSANFAGYSVSQNFSPDFAMHVMLVIPQISEQVKTQLRRETFQSEVQKESSKSSKQETTENPSLASQPEIKLGNRIKCPQCGEQLFAGIIYCPYCSSHLPSQRA